MTLSRFFMLCALCCLFLSPAHGQIIVNSQFHALNPLSSLNTCSTADATVATSINRLQDMCANWMTPTNGTPDYFYGCDKVPTGTPDYGVPVQTWFTGNCEDPSYPYPSSPEDVRAYAGIELIDNANAANRDREYITQQLITPLQVGRKYIISLRVRSSNLHTEYLVKRLGCLLSTHKPTTGHTSDNNNGALPTSMGNYAEGFNASGWDANSWQLISLPVTITDSVRSYITIGNFQENIPDAEWVAQPGMPAVPANGGRGYYFIDDVTICDVCPTGVEIERVNFEDPTKCCYQLSFLGDINNFCNTLTGFRIIKTGVGYGDTIYTYNGPVDESPFEICVDRFTSGLVLIEMFDEQGTLCGFMKELACNCQCWEFENPPQFKIEASYNSSNAAQCCWDIIISTHYKGGDPRCDLLLRGIAIDVDPTVATITPTNGYMLNTAPDGTRYLTLNDANEGDLYEMTGTFNFAARICVPQGTVDFPVVFKLLKAFDGAGNMEYCGTDIREELTCANKCCLEVVDTSLRPVTSSDPLKCCFAIDVEMAEPRKCIASLTLQYKNSVESPWADELSMSPLSQSFSIPLCITVGTSKSVRMLFKDAGGNVVCIRTYSLKCEDECCKNVQELYAYRVSQNPCCFNVQGYVVDIVEECPDIYDYEVQQYHKSTGTWTTSTSGMPDMDGFFDSYVCLDTLSATIRIVFRDSKGRVVCTRWLHLACDNLPPEGGGGKGKMGLGSSTGSLFEKAYIAPNPAIGETTVHYSLREESNVRISLYNTIGEVVAEVPPALQAAGSQSAKISVAHIPEGMYFIQISTGNSLITLPVTIRK